MDGLSSHQRKKILYRKTKSTDEGGSRSRQFPRLLKQTSFASTLQPNFNKNLRHWNIWTYPEISRANRIVVDHLKSRRQLRSSVSEDHHTLQLYGIVPENLAEAKFLKRTNSEVNQPADENASKKTNGTYSKEVLILPKLEKVFNRPNDHEKSNLIRLLYKGTTTTTTTTTNNNNNNNNAGQLASHTNQNLQSDSNLTDNPASLRVLRNNDDSNLPIIRNPNLLSRETIEKQNDRQGPTQLPAADRGLIKNLHSLRDAESYRGSKRKPGNETASSQCADHAQRAGIKTKNYLSCDLSLLSLDDETSSLGDEHLRQDDVRKDLNENRRKELTVENGDSSSASFSAPNEETGPATISEDPVSIKDPFLVPPPDSGLFCNTGANTTGAKRKIYNGDITIPVPINNNLFRICVWAGRDMSEECTAFHKNLFPRLRLLGQQTGIQIEIFDLHLTQSDSTFLDSFREKLFTAILDKCFEPTYQSRIVLLLGEKYGSPVLPSTFSSMEFSSLQRQLIARLAAQDTTDQRLGVPRSLRSSSQGSRRSRAGSASGNRRLKPPRKNHAASVSRVGTPSGKSPRAPAILIQEEKLPRNEGGDNDLTGSSNGGCAHASVQSEKLKNLYRAEKREGLDVYRLKTLKFTESESGKWKEHIDAILEVLPKLKSTPEQEKCQQSLLHSVLSSCLSKTTAADDDRFVCVVRNVANITNNLQTWAEHNYFDTNTNNNEINRKLHQKIKELRKNFIKSKVPSGSLVELQLDLNECVTQSLRQRQFGLYVNRMQDKLYEKLSAIISNIKYEQEDKVLQEVLHHVTFYQQRVRDSCLIQKKILYAIMAYITSTKPHPLILCGPDGCGKTTLMSLAAAHMNIWTESTPSKNHVLVRSIGCTRESTNICDLLHGLCTQLQDIFHILVSVPTDYTGLINQVSQMLSYACATEKLVIFIDGVDLLEGAPGMTLQWIPKEIPAHVRLILSTRSQEKHSYLKFLQKTFVQPDVFKEILPLDEPDAEVLLETLEKRHKRILPPQKRTELIYQFQRDRIPLNLALYVTEHFLSETALETTNLSEFGPGIKELVRHKFEDLEQKFGRGFVQRVLGYLSTVKFGLAFGELEAVLAIDKALVTSSHSSPQQLSSYQLLSFLAELRPYLQECVDGSYRVLCWSHQIFHEAAEDRYLKNQVQTLAYHRNLAMFFNCGPPIFACDKSETSPAVQPLFYNKNESLTKVLFNSRKIKELPYHILQSQQTDAFKKDIVFSFEWMQAELCATSFANVLRLHAEAELAEPQNPELGLLTTALRLSESTLKRSPDQLASQLIGRLSFLSRCTVHTSSGEALKYPNLAQLIDSARHSPFPALLPPDSCLVEPGDELAVHLYAHVAQINAMDLTDDGECLLTASQDDSVKVWDMRNGWVIKNIKGIGARVRFLIWAVNNTCVVTVEPGFIRVWLLSDQRCLYSFETGFDSVVITAVSNADSIRSSLLVGIFDGTNKINVWDLQDGSCRSHSVSLKGTSIHQSRSVLLARNCQSKCFLYSFRDSNDAVLQNATTGNVVYSLQCRESASTVVGVAVTPDYFVLACRQLYLKTQEIHQLELFDASNGLYLRTVRGCVHDVISSSLVVPSTGSNILTLSTSRQNNVSNVIVWNLETESHKHLAKHPGISKLLVCGHVRRVLTVSKGDNYVKEWDLSVRINETTPEMKSVSNMVQIIVTSRKPNCFVTLTSNNGPIELWTFDNGLNKISTTPKEFLDSSDIVLVNNTKLVILSDRKIPSITDDFNQVFQSILIYDMETEQYDHKLTGCYIDVSPPYDYAILPGDRLMGLSSSRSHFIIWSLSNGQVVQRIKSCFKDLNWSNERRSRKYLRARESVGNLTPWEQRSETVSDRAKRQEQKMEEERCRLHELRKEKENQVDGFLLSGNHQILVASYFAHHLCVFAMETQKHLATVEDESAMLFLNVAAITADGSHFVHATYDEMRKTSYVTLRESHFGQVKRRLKNEKDVCAIALTDNADRVVMAKHTNEIHIWDPMVTNSLRKRKLSKSMKLDFGSRLFLIGDGRRAVLLAGQISLWDLDRAEMIATFSPDNTVLCSNIISQEDLIVLGLPEKTQPVILTVKNASIKDPNS